MSWDEVTWKDQAEAAESELVLKEWEGIHTAPMNGEKILVWVPSEHGPRIARWLIESAATPCWCAVDGGSRVSPSLWMPLPPAPSRGDE